MSIYATAGEDYTATPRQLTFGPNNYGSLCITFKAATDLVSEDSETLTLKITTTDQSLDLNPDTATITILDNTSRPWRDCMDDSEGMACVLAI